MIGPEYDPQDLCDVGWGIVATAGLQHEIRQAVEPLLKHRQGRWFEYRRGESTADFLTRHGAGRGDVDPVFLPYYLLLVGSPEDIPFDFQAYLGIQYAVGRLWFDEVGSFSRYVEKIIQEGPNLVPRLPRYAFFCPRHADDAYSEILSTQLAAPLVAELQATLRKAGRENKTVLRFFWSQARKARLAGLLAENYPGLLFAAGHGLGTAQPDAQQRRRQGSLVCQDWQGAHSEDEAIQEQDYFSAEDVQPWDLSGLLAIFYASYSLGTPADQMRDPAESPFIAALPQRLLAGGALGVAGMVGRAWGLSYYFDEDHLKNSFSDLLTMLTRGDRLGYALQMLKRRIADFNANLDHRLEKYLNTPGSDPKRLAELWTAGNDLQNLLILGDPAVRLLPELPQAAAASAVSRSVVQRIESGNRYADLEIWLARGSSGGDYWTEIRLDLPESATVQAPAGGRASFRFDHLRTLLVNPEKYGQALTESLFADPQVHAFFGKSLALVDSAGIELRVRLSTDAPELFELRWETLSQPWDQAPLLLRENLTFTRYIRRQDWEVQRLKPSGSLKALLVVSNPGDIQNIRTGNQTLAPVDVALEINLARQVLARITVDVLASDPSAPGQVTLENLTRRLADGPYDILYWVSHATAVERRAEATRRPVLVLEEANGKASYVAVEDFADRFRDLPADLRPRLVVLLPPVNTEGAGSLFSGEAQDAWTVIAANLVSRVTAMALTMQGTISLVSFQYLMGRFFDQLFRNGQVDRAVAVARHDMPERADYWKLLFFSAGKNARMWSEEFPSASVLPLMGTLPEPGSLPAGSRMPLPRNPFFTGREAELLAVAKDLFYEQTSGRGPVVISGMAGSGKSLLALELCYRYGRFLDAVYWLDAKEDLNAEIAACGAAMDLPGGAESVEGRAIAVLEQWSQGVAAGKEYLVVLDSLQNTPPLFELMPRLAGLRVLVTSRKQRWPAALKVRSHRLSVLGRAESRALLRAIAPELQDTPDELLDQLAIRLDNLPAALTTAAAYFLENHLTVDEYLDRLEAMGKGRRESTLPGDLNEIIALSWKQLQAEDAADEMARRIFLASGYCAADLPIPVDLLRQAVNWDQDWAEYDIQAGLRRLYQLGLLFADLGSPMINPWAAKYARTIAEPLEATSDSPLSRLATALAALGEQALESGLPGRFIPLREHMRLVAMFTEQAGMEQAGALWGLFGAHWLDMAEFRAARVVLETAVRVDKAKFGAEHPQIATYLSNLGQVLLEQDDLDGAQALFERAQALDEKNYEADHPKHARDQYNLGVIALARGELDEAQQKFSRAWRLASQVYSEANPETAEYLTGVGRARLAKDDLLGAQTTFLRARAIEEKLFGADHPRVARIMARLGFIHYILGELERAQEEFLRARSILEATYGAEHPQIAAVVENLGQALEASGDLGGAHQAFERALMIYQKTYGPDHTLAAKVYNDLAVVYLALGELDAAKEMIGRALEIDQKVTGGNHPNVVRDLQTYALYQRDAGDLILAGVILKDALAIARKIYDPGAIAIASLIYDQGNLLLLQGDLAGAAERYRLALSGYGGKLPAEHATIYSIKKKLAELELRAAPRIPGE